MPGRRRASLKLAMLLLGALSGASADPSMPGKVREQQGALVEPAPARTGSVPESRVRSSSRREGAGSQSPRHPNVSTMQKGYVVKPHVGSFAWTDAQWRRRCRGVRTSYNPDQDLSDDLLTLGPNDPRWLDFVFWSLSNKVNEHQVEAYGGTGWKGPKGGVVFHWAPGSHWEQDSLHSFAFFIGHVVGEHRWTDSMFPDFFEKYGGVYGINIKDRLVEIAPGSSAPWIEFLEYSAGLDSPYFRYLLHIDSSVDVNRGLIALAAGQGVAFNYSFDRYRHELAMILTDCRAVDFLQMYDRFGPGFAAEGDWARQPMPPSALSRVGYADHIRFFEPGLGSGGAAPSTRPPKDPERIDVPSNLPETDRMRRGEKVYFAQCMDCHGAAGDGAGFLAESLDVKPRDFRQGQFKFRSTLKGELPAIADIERSVRDGVAGTTMPAWSQFLTEREIADVARYLAGFSPRFIAALREHRQARALKVSRAPAEMEELSAHPTGDLHPCLNSTGVSLPCRGEQLWNVYQCRWCHGDDRRGDGPTAPGLRDEWGNPSRPADLTYKWLFKNGHRPDDVYRSIFAGLNGTPMDSYARFIGDERDRWALVAYVLSLSPAIRPALHLADFATQRAKRIGAGGRILAPSPGVGP